MMKRMRLLLLALLATAAAFCCSEDVWAQRRVPYYETRPPISPWFYMNRGNVGGWPAYYAWVLPEQRMRDFVQREQLERERLDLLQQQLMVRPTTGTGQPATVGGYMNYLHFYPLNAPAQQGIRRRR